MLDDFYDLERAEWSPVPELGLRQLEEHDLSASRTAVNNVKALLKRSYWQLSPKPSISHSWSQWAPTYNCSAIQESRLNPVTRTPGSSVSCQSGLESSEPNSGDGTAAPHRTRSLCDMAVLATGPCPHKLSRNSKPIACFALTSFPRNSVSRVPPSPDSTALKESSLYQWFSNIRGIEIPWSAP